MKSDDVSYACTRAVREALREAGIRDRRGSIEHREVAIRQAADMEKQRLVNVELRRERDRALADREAALDLAEQYARQAGCDPARDESLRYVAQYWEQRGTFENTWTALERQRWDNLCVARDLGDVVSGKLVFTGDVAAFAALLATELTAINNAQGGAKRTVGLFERPAPPTTPARPPTVGAHDDGLFAIEPDPAPEPVVVQTRSRQTTTRARKVKDVETSGAVL